MYLGFALERARPEPDHRLPDARRPAEAQRDQRRAARRHPRRPHFAMRVWLKPDQMAALGISPVRRPRRARATTTTSPRSARPRARWCRSTWSRTPTCRRRRSSSSSSSSRRTASSSASARSPTSCSAPRTTTTDVRFNGQTATFMGIWVLPTANSLDVIKRVRAEMPGHPGAAAGRHDGRHPVRRDRVHPGRDRRGAEDARPRRCSSSSSSSSCSSARSARCSSRSSRSRSRSIGAVFLMLVVGLHDQPADAARDRAVRRPRRRRRHRHGRERRAPPAARREAVRGGAARRRASSSGRSSR